LPKPSLKFFAARHAANGGDNILSGKKLKIEFFLEGAKNAHFTES
jgi:hypothetical protein